MPLIRSISIDDLRFVKQLDVLNQRSQFIRELASAILPLHDDFETVWSIANRVYDLHCLPRAGGSDRSSFAKSRMTALSA
jgi:hypothetical protein